MKKINPKIWTTFTVLASIAFLISYAGNSAGRRPCPA